MYSYAGLWSSCWLLFTLYYSWYVWGGAWLWHQPLASCWCLLPWFKSMYWSGPGWLLCPMCLILGWMSPHADTWWNCPFRWLYGCYFFGVWVLSRIYRGNLRNPVIASLVTCNNIFSSSVIAMVFWLKLSSHMASHNFPMDMRELCASPDRMWGFSCPLW